MDGDDYRPRCRRGHFMKGTVYVTQGSDVDVEWRCDYCRRRNQKPTGQEQER